MRKLRLRAVKLLDSDHPARKSWGIDLKPCPLGINTHAPGQLSGLVPCLKVFRPFWLPVMGFQFSFSFASQLVLVSASDLWLACFPLGISWVAWPFESSTALSTSDMGPSPCTHLNREYRASATSCQPRRAPSLPALGTLWAGPRDQLPG